MRNIRTLLTIFLCSSLFVECGDGNGDSSKMDLVGETVNEVSKTSKSIGGGGTFHDQVFTVDLIQDLVFRNERDGWTLGTDEAQVNVDKLRVGGVNFILSALPTTRGERSFESLSRMIAKNKELVDGTNGAVRIVSNFAEVLKYKGENVITMMILLEGADALEGRLEIIPDLRKQGLAAVGLVSSYGNAFADSAVHPRERGGLSEQGVALLQICRDNGIAVDVTHASKRAFWDVMVEQTGVVMASHTAARALREHPRNLDDLQILGLSRYGGVMGLVFNPELLRPESVTPVGIDDVVAHVMHIKALGALNSLALGTDFNGIKPPSGLSDVSQMNKLRKALVQQGLGNAEVRGIFGENASRMFEEVERKIGVQNLTRDDIHRPVPIECDGAIGEYDGMLVNSCNGYIHDVGAELEQSTRQKIRIRGLGLTPVELEIFGEPNTPWQVEGQNLPGKVLFTRTVALDNAGRTVVSLPQNRGLVRIYFSPTRKSNLREIVVWGR